MRSEFGNRLLLAAALAMVPALISCGSSSPAGPPPPPPPPPTTVTVTPTTATLYRGETQQFAAQVSGPSDQTVTWSVDGPGSIDSTGLYTAPTDYDGFAILVIATSNAVRSALASATVTLPSVTLTITPYGAAVVPGSSRPFSAAVVGLSSSQVSWTVQGAGGGTITSAGLYTAPSTIGIYQVVATSSVNKNYSAAATVAVTTTPASFTPTGDLNQGRLFHTATLLTDGKVLVAGSAVYKAYCLAGDDSAELYDATLGSFAYTGTMADRRYGHTATRLQNGEVLMTGGFSFDSSACLVDETSPGLASAELYDPANGSFLPTGSMTEVRGGHTATLLKSGKVLVAGGGTVGGGDPQFGNGSITAEVYDPLTSVFTSTGNMTTGRVGQTATLLADGKVLIVGGLASAADPVATAELYDPTTGVFTLTGSMSAGRAGHTATLLQDGRVLVTGGFTDQTLVASDTAEIYDPSTKSFLATTTPMVVARWSHTATLLPNGTVLLVGGGSVVAEIYDPSAGSFSPSAVTEFDRSGHSATLLNNGKVIVIGGGLFEPASTTAELYP